jgi:hypothetical protein
LRREASLIDDYHVCEYEVEGVHVLGHPGVQTIVLMVHFMDLIGGGVCVEEAVEAIEEEVFEVVDEQDLKSKLFEGGKAL